MPRVPICGSTSGNQKQIHSTRAKIVYPKRKEHAITMNKKTKLLVSTTDLRKVRRRRRKIEDVTRLINRLIQVDASI